MRSNRQLAVSAFGLPILLAACGGSSSPESTAPAVNAEGAVVTTAGGATVTEAAHNYWQEGLAFFQEHERSGWTPDACESSVRNFSRAAEAQGGRFAEALYMAGLSHARCGQANEARALYERTLSVNENFCKARVAIGVEQLTSNATQAAATFRQAIAGDRTCTEAYVNLASIMRTSGDAAQLAEAVSNLRKALTLDAQYMPAFNEMALVYYQQAATDSEKIDLAAIVCVQAIRINPAYAPIYNTMGLVQLRRGDLIEAVRAFGKAIELDDTIVEAHMNFGQITLGFRGYADAQRSFAKVIELESRNYDARIGLGAALRGLGRFDEAQAAYEAARDIDTNRPEAYYNLALLYQDYRGGSVEALRQAKGFFEQFLQKAASNSRYASSVEDVRRRCESRSGGNRRRLASAQCRPGRLQNIDTAIEAQAAMAQMQAMQAAQQPPATPAAPAPAPSESAPAPAPQ